ncbi:MAG: hypothetical protein ACI8T1_003219, partial [Verrucomicrobiales bacterium]
CKQAYLECACTFTHSGRGANLTPLTKFVSTRPNSLHLSRHPTQDPFGYRWSFGQFLEEVSPEEMAQRAKELYEG